MKLTTVIAGALALGLGATTGSASAMGSERPQPPVATATPRTAGPIATSQLALPTGDVIRVAEGPTGPVVTPDGAFTGGGATVYRVGRSTYVVPHSVASLVGTKLSAQLFDVRALSAGDPDRVPVTITYAAPDSPTPVTGVDITRRAGRTAYGYLTRASRARFKAALAGQGAGRLLRNVAEIAGHGTPANPTWAMHTVAIDVVGVDGRPSGATIAVLNVDDPAKPSYLVGANGTGRSKVSLPTGRYQVIGAATDPVAGVSYLASTREFVVDAARSVTLDLRTATTPLVTRLHRAARRDMVVTALTRTISKGGTDAVNEIEVIETSGRPTHFYLSPTVGSLTGTQTLQRFVSASSPKDSADRYTYTTYHSRTGAIPSSEIEFRSDTSNLTAYASSFYGPAEMPGAVVRTAIADRLETRTFDTPLGGPARLTRYVTASPGVTVGTTYVQQPGADGDRVGVFTAPASVQVPGVVARDGWGKPALHGRFLTTPQAPGDPVWCPACINDYFVGVAQNPMADNNIAHSGAPDVVGGADSGRYALTGGGMTLASGTGAINTSTFYLPGTKTLSLTQSGRRTLSGATAASVTTTTSVRPKAAIALPSGWLCSFGDDCRVLPFLSADYDAPINLSGRLAAGRQQIGVTVRQVGRANAVGVTSVKAWIRYGEGSWRAMPARGEGAAYKVAVDIPTVTRPTPVSLRVAVADQAGSTLTETMTNAFTLPQR